MKNSKIVELADHNIGYGIVQYLLQNFLSNILCVLTNTRNDKSNVQIGGGTVVIKDIELSGLYIGNPARFIR